MPLSFHAETCFWRRILCLGCVVVLCGVSGCSRSFWRNQADDDTYELVNEKMTNPEWCLPRIDIEPDPRSRFYDPYDPDYGPMPPDDPWAHEYLHDVAGYCGYKSWHQFGDAMSVENPQWLTPFALVPTDGTEASQAINGDPSAEIQLASHEEELPIPAPPVSDTDDAAQKGGKNTAQNKAADSNQMLAPGIRNLALVEALELATIHSRSYQTEIENLFLSALQLTLERFQFQVRYLGTSGREPSLGLAGETEPGGDDSLSLTGRVGLRQLLPTGGQWAVELANNTLWLFSGENQTTSASVLSFSLVQPLLLGAGRKIVLEDLTQQERDVLYEVRDLARFRKTFFTANVSGYLDLIEQQQTVVNQRGNNMRLEEQTEIQRALSSKMPDELTEPLETFPAGLEFPERVKGQVRYIKERKLLAWRGPMSEEQAEVLIELSPDLSYQKAVASLIQRLRTEVLTLSVAQLETRLARSRNTLRNAERSLQDQLDRYKLRIGLPPDMPITLDNSMLKPFELISPHLKAIEEEAKEYVTEWAKLDAETSTDQEIREVVSGLKMLEAKIRDIGVELVKHDSEVINNLLLLAEKEPSHQLVRKRFDTPESLARTQKDVANDRRLFAAIQNALDNVNRELTQLEQQVSQKELTLEQKRESIDLIETIRARLMKNSQNLQVIQIGLRVEAIVLEPFTLDMDRSVALGMEHRLDLKNELAAVTDARRVVEIRANQLEAVLDLRVEGTIGTSSGNRPFDFRGDESTYRAGLAFTAPIDQVQQRNNYRSALISYQRARRAYMEAEDQVKLEVRQSWRQLEVLKQNFENNRQSVRLAALQYDNAVEESTGPAGKGGSSNALNLLEALDSVLEAQDSLIGSWVEYEKSRLNIYRDMGIMEIDARGIWVDDFYQSRAFPPPTEDPHDLPPDRPQPISAGDAVPSAEQAGAVALVTADGTVFLEGTAVEESGAAGADRRGAGRWRKSRAAAAADEAAGVE